jgi:hypothetical protein
MDRVYETLDKFIDDYPDEFKAVQAILVEYWDHIDAAAGGERAAYDPYVPQVVFLGLGGASAMVIADHLADVEVRIMGQAHSTPQQWLRCKKAADAIVQYFESHKK